MSPSADATVSGAFVQIVIRADALGAENFVSFVNVTLNSEKAGEAIPAGEHFLFRLNSTEYLDGSYRLEAVGFDRNEARGISAPVLLTFENTSVAPGPAMDIIAPANQENVLGLTRVVARTLPGQGTVNRVELLANGIPVLTTTEVSGNDTYVFDWDTSSRIPGEHILEVKAFDSQGLFSLSDPVTVHVDAIENPDDDGPPGTVMWRAAGYRGEVKGSVAVGFNNDIYVASSSDTLYVFWPDGSEKWTFSAKGPIRSAPIVGNNEDVFLTSEDGRLYGLDSDGHPLWPGYNTGAVIRATPTLGIEGALFFGDVSGRVHSVSSFDGQPSAGNWPVAVSGSSIAAPAVITRNRTIIVGSSDGYVYALRPDGTLAWQSTENVGSITLGMALVEQEQASENPDEDPVTISILYAVSDTGNLYAFSAVDGAILWDYTLSGPMRSGPIVGTDGTIYVGTSTGLIALNPEMDEYTPRLRFVFPADDAGMPAIDSNETVYFVSRHRLHAINPNNTPYWTFDLGSESDAPLTIRRDGALLVAGQNGILTAFETGSVGLGRGNWPMFQRNARHTGRIGIDSGD